jgi:hypothetical protein
MKTQFKHLPSVTVKMCRVCLSMSFCLSLSLSLPLFLSPLPLSLSLREIERKKKINVLVKECFGAVLPEPVEGMRDRWAG